MRDTGRESRIMNRETAVVSNAQTPGPSSHSEKRVCEKIWLFAASNFSQETVIHLKSAKKIETIHLQKNKWDKDHVWLSPPRFSWLDFFLKNPMTALIWCLGPDHVGGCVSRERLREKCCELRGLQSRGWCVEWARGAHHGYYHPEPIMDIVCRTIGFSLWSYW